MVPFDVMTGKNCMVCNSRGVADLCEGFEMLGLPVMQSSFCFADVEGITVPTTGIQNSIQSQLLGLWFLLHQPCLIPVDLFQRINKNSKAKVKKTVNCTWKLPWLNNNILIDEMLSIIRLLILMWLITYSQALCAFSPLIQTNMFLCSW